MLTNEKLQALLLAGESLDRAATSLDEQLEVLEAAIGRANLRVTVWLAERIGESEWHTDTDESSRETADHWRLGYAQCWTGRWCVAVKHMEAVGHGGDVRYTHEIDVLPLKAAPHEVREAAAGLIEPLIDRLVQRANAITAAFKRGQLALERASAAVGAQR